MAEGELKNNNNLIHRTFCGLPVLGTYIHIQQERLGDPVQEPLEITALVQDGGKCVYADGIEGEGVGMGTGAGDGL